MLILRMIGQELIIYIYIYNTPCQRIQLDRLTGEEKIVERREKIEITHNGMRTGGRTI